MGNCLPCLLPQNDFAVLTIYGMPIGQVINRCDFSKSPFPKAPLTQADMQYMNGYWQNQTCQISQSNNENSNVEPDFQNFQQYKKQFLCLPKVKKIKKQFFCFPKAIIYYVVTHGSSKIYSKLIKSCKYFFISRKITLVARVVQQSNQRFDRSIPLSRNQISKIWITRFIYSLGKTGLNELSILCTKIYKCEAGVLCIGYQKITQREFQLIVNPNTVWKLLIWEMDIQKSNGELMVLDEVVECVPNTTRIRISGFKFTRTTFTNLANFDRNKKLERFRCTLDINNDPTIHSMFDVGQFLIFASKYCCASNSGRVDISLKDPVPTLFDANEAQINEFLESTPTDQRPDINIRSETAMQNFAG